MQWSSATRQVTGMSGGSADSIHSGQACANAVKYAAELQQQQSPVTKMRALVRPNQQHMVGFAVTAGEAYVPQGD